LQQLGDRCAKAYYMACFLFLVACIFTPKELQSVLHGILLVLTYIYIYIYICKTNQYKANPPKKMDYKTTSTIREKHPDTIKPQFYVFVVPIPHYICLCTYSRLPRRKRLLMTGQRLIMAGRNLISLPSLVCPPHQNLLPSGAALHSA